MLAPAPGSLQIDATLGGGGHTERILEATDPDGRLLGLDADGAAIARVAGRLQPRFGDRLVLRQANFRELADGRARRPASARSTAACSTSACPASSSPTRERGFGFRAGGPLDMRFDTSRGVPAAELLATLDASELTALFRRYGEEPHAPAGSRGPSSMPARTAPDHAPPRSSPRSSSASRRRTRAAGAGSIPRRASSRRCASRSTRSSTRSRRGSPPRSTCSGRAAGSWSSATTRSRTASSSASSHAERRGCVCPPEVPVCVCGRNPRLRLVTRPSLPRPTAEIAANPAPGAPACGPPSESPPDRPPVTTTERRSPDEQAPPVQPPPSRTAVASTRSASGSDRRHQPTPPRSSSTTWGAAAPADPFAFLDPRAPRLRFAHGRLSDGRLRGRAPTHHRAARARRAARRPTRRARCRRGAEPAAPSAPARTEPPRASSSAASSSPSCSRSSRWPRRSASRPPATTSAGCSSSATLLDAAIQELNSDLNRLGREPAIRKLALDDGLGQLGDPLVLPAR